MKNSVNKEQKKGGRRRHEKQRDGEDDQVARLRVIQQG